MNLYCTIAMRLLFKAHLCHNKERILYVEDAEDH